MHSEERNLPFSSIIVPVFNEADNIEACLEALLNLNYPNDLFEVIVVDNGSTDGTLEKVKKYPVKVEKKVGVRVGAVRNTGARISNGEILGFVDGDCIVPENWLLAGVKTLSDNCIGAVGGDCMLPSKASWVERAWVLQKEPLTGQGHLLRGGSILTRRKEFFELGGFDEYLSAGEDTDFTRKIRASGLSVTLINECAVVHLGYPKEIKRFMLRQYWHASSSLSRSNFVALDKTLLLTIFFMALVFCFTALVITGWRGTPYLFVLILMCPLILSLKRFNRSGWPKVSFLRMFQIYVLDLVYLVGRSMGIGRNFMENIGLRKNRKTYY